MSVIPCEKNAELRRLIEQYSEILKTEAHKLGDHGTIPSAFGAVAWRYANRANSDPKS